MARKLSALSGFYDYGVHDAQVLTHSPASSVRRPRVSDESQAVGLTADELRLLLIYAAQHSPRSLALVSLLTLCGLRISKALNAEVRDYGHDHGHRVLKVTRKGGKTARVALAPPVLRALDDYLAGRTTGCIFIGRDGEGAYGYRLAYAQLGQREAEQGGRADAYLIGQLASSQPEPLLRGEEVGAEQTLEVKAAELRQLLRRLRRRGH